jgi:hypothetical protein
LNWSTEKLMGMVIIFTLRDIIDILDTHVLFLLLIFLLKNSRFNEDGILRVGGRGIESWVQML